MVKAMFAGARRSRLVGRQDREAVVVKVTPSGGEGKIPAERFVPREIRLKSPWRSF